MKFFETLPLKPNQWLAPFIASLFAVICFFAEDRLFTGLGYYHSKIVQGEVWRLITGHFFHANDNHVIMNLLGLWCLLILHGEYYNRKNMVGLYFLSALSTALGMFYFSPEVEIYVGLSGILHGILIWGALKDIQHKHNMGYFLLVATIGKIGYEQIFGASDDVVKLIEMNVAINAHLFGALAGLIAFMFDKKMTKATD